MDESKTFSIRVQPDLLAWLKKQAKKEMRSLNNFVVVALLDLKNRKSGKK